MVEKFVDFYYQEEKHRITLGGYLYRQTKDDFGNFYFTPISVNNNGVLIFELAKEKKMCEERVMSLSYPDQEERLVTEEVGFEDVPNEIYGAGHSRYGE